MANAKINLFEGGRKSPPTKKRRYRFFSIRTAFILFALAPALIHLLVFWLGVQVESIRMAFTDINTEKLGLGNFEWVLNALKNPREPLGEGFKNTLIFFTMSVCMMPVSLFTVYLIYKKCFMSNLLRILIYLPGAISGMMMPLLFKNIIRSDFVRELFGGADLLGVQYALKTILTYDIWMALGSNLVIWLGAMGRIPPDVIEYGKLDGIGPLKEFIHIILPLIWPTFVTMLTLQIIGIFGSSGSVMIFTEGKNGTYTISYWLYDVVYNRASAQMQRLAVAAGLLLTVVSIPIVIIGRLIMNKFGEAVEY